MTLNINLIVFFANLKNVVFTIFLPKSEFSEIFDANYDPHLNAMSLVYCKFKKQKNEMFLYK